MWPLLLCGEVIKVWKGCLEIRTMCSESNLHVSLTSWKLDRILLLDWKWEIVLNTLNTIFWCWGCSVIDLFSSDIGKRCQTFCGTRWCPEFLLGVLLVLWADELVLLSVPLVLRDLLGARQNGGITITGAFRLTRCLWHLSAESKLCLTIFTEETFWNRASAQLCTLHVMRWMLDGSPC